MAKLSLKAGTTSKSVRFFVQDSSQTVIAGLVGLAYNTANLVAYYIKEGAATVTAISLVNKTVGTWVSGGFAAIDGANMPGMYELDLPDLALSVGKSVLVYLKGATNMSPVQIEIELTAVDNQSATAFVNSVPAVVGAVGSVAGVTFPSVVPSAGQNATAVMTDVSDAIGADILAIKSKTDALSATPAADVVTAMFAHLIETGVTFAQAMEAIAAVVAGNVNTGTAEFSAIGNTGTNRVHYAIDGSGNRTVTLTL